LDGGRHADDLDNASHPAHEAQIETKAVILCAKLDKQLQKLAARADITARRAGGIGKTK
jgi:regulator of protease activity HflC (stomatin/prohibitin superfamily)